MLLVGIDQSQKKHDVCLMNELGRQLACFEIPHDVQGFQRLHEERQRIQVSPQDCVVALESGHSLLIDYLLDLHYQVYVIPGKAVDRYRDRHRQSRSASDKTDAVVLAEVLRTDRHLHTPWHADQPITRQIRSLVSLVHDLKRFVVGTSNRLRSLLWRYYPIAAELFSGLDQQITLQFILAYPTPQQAKQLTMAQFTAFCRAHKYYRSDLITRRYGQLLNAQTFARSEIATAYASQAQAWARVILSLVEERDQAQKLLTQAFEQHPDCHVFESLPGAGEFLAPALLSRFRDCRARFPTASVAQATAGTSPVTVQSGKKRRVQFRRACDKDFRYYAGQFARCSIREAPWASAYFATVRPRCEKASQAYRCLANRWIAIIWRLWTDRVVYDEAVHLRNRHTGQRPG